MPKLSKKDLYYINKNVSKIMNERSENRILCKCGHSVLIPPQLDKICCDHCGNYVFRNNIDEFKYRLKVESIKLKRKDRNGNN